MQDMFSSLQGPFLKSKGGNFFCTISWLLTREADVLSLTPSRIRDGRKPSISQSRWSSCLQRLIVQSQLTTRKRFQVIFKVWQPSGKAHPAMKHALKCSEGLKNIYNLAFSLNVVVFTVLCRHKSCASALGLLYQWFLYQSADHMVLAGPIRVEWSDTNTKHITHLRIYLTAFITWSCSGP